MNAHVRNVVVASFFIAASSLQAGVMMNPGPDEVIASLGDPRADDASGTVSFELRFYFGSGLSGRSVSFVGINVEHSSIDNVRLDAESDLFAAFAFIPASDSEIAAWSPPLQIFGSQTLGLDERAGFPGIAIAPLQGMLVGAVVFDYRSAGLIDGQRFKIDLTGGGPAGLNPSGTQTTIGLDSISGFDFFDPTFAPGSRTVVLGDVLQSHPVAEPSGLTVFVFLAIGCGAFTAFRASVRRRGLR